MGGAATVVGLGLSAVGTVNQINQQKRQAEAKKESLQTQNMLAREQLELSREQFQANKETARVAHERELQLIDAQEQQSKQQLESQQIQQQTALLQTRAQAEQIEQEARQRALSILGQAEGQSIQNLNQQQAGQEQIGRLAEQGQQVTSQQRQARAAERQQDAADQATDAGRLGAVNPQAVEAQQDLAGAQRRTMQNIENLEEQRQATTGFARERADLAEQAGAEPASFLRGQAGRQQRAFDIQNEINRQNIEFQTQQNRLASEASFFANQASRSAQQASRFIQTKSRISQNLSKQSAIQSPGFLDYATAGARLAGQAAQSGLLGGGSTGVPQTTTSNQQAQPFATGVNVGGGFDTEQTSFLGNDAQFSGQTSDFTF